MKFLEKWFSKWGYLKIPSGVGGVTYGGIGWQTFSNLGNNRKQIESYQNHVYKCVTLIYRRAISISMRLYKERGDQSEEVMQHPALDLLRKPNPYMTGRDLKAITFMHRDLTGKAFWLKVMNGLGRPVELWPLSVADFSRFIFNKEGTDLQGYEFKRSSGGVITYDPEEIIYFRYPHPQYFFEGASPVQAMAYAYDIDLAIRVYQRKFFQNSARPDIVFESANPIQAEDAKRLLMSWKQAHQGAERSWEPAILDNGLKINPLTMAAKDFEFIALAKWTKEDIMEAYNIPEGKLGTVTDVNRANGIAIDQTFNSECITPRLDSYEETLTNGLLSHYDTGIYFVHDSCVPKDLEFMLKERETNLRTKTTTINEEREKQGLDEVPWGTVPWIQINEMQYGQDLGVVNVSKEKDARTDRLHLIHDRNIAARAKGYQGFLKKEFKRQEQETLKNLEEVYNRVDGAIRGMSIKKAGAWLDTHKDVVDRIYFDQQVANKKLTEGSGPYIDNFILDGGTDALTGIGSSDVVFDMLNPRVVTWAGMKLRKIRDINTTTRDALQTTLREGFEAGESVRSMAKRVNAVFAEAGAVRSLRIAQTESNSAANFGTLEGYQQSGVVEMKEWLAGAGARETHSAAAAQYQGTGAIHLNDNFQVGAGSGPCPGSIGLPEEDINCFLPGTMAEGSIVAASKAFYSGPVWEIKTGRGYTLTITPNHPVMTNKGWTPAKDIAKGTNLFSYRNDLKGAMLQNKNNQNGPASVKDIFDSIRMNGRERSAMVMPLDLHGDAALCNSKIDIVYVNGVLPLDRQIIERRDQSSNLKFILSGRFAGVPEKGEGSLPFSFGGINFSTAGSPSGMQLALDEEGIFFDAFPLDPLRFGLSSQWDIFINQKSCDNAPTAMEFLGNLVDASAGLIGIDKVIAVREYDFSGHVFDLQSVNGWIITQNIVTSNCRCALLPQIRKR